MLVTPTEALLREQAASMIGGFPITQLGPEQERLIAVYREEYFRVGSCTEPADRPRAERAISELYRSHGYDPPRFEWGGGPKWGAELSRSRASVSANGNGPHTLHEDFDSTAYPLFQHLESFVALEMEKYLLIDAWRELEVSISRSFRSALYGSLGQEWRFALDGSLEVHWIVVYVYAHEVLMVPYPNQILERIYLHDEIARSVGMWWPFRDVCICTERPGIIDWIPGTPPRMFKAYYRDGLEVTGKR